MGMIIEIEIEKLFVKQRFEFALSFSAVFMRAEGGFLRHLQAQVKPLFTAHLVS